MNPRSLSPLLVLVLVGCSGVAPVEGGDAGGGGTSTSSGPGSGAGPDGGGGGTTTSTGGSGGDAPVARTTRTALDANDTSASSAFVDSYTPATRFDGSATPVSNATPRPARSRRRRSPPVGSRRSTSTPWSATSRSSSRCGAGFAPTG